jgi:hypothetical protein
MSAHGAGRIEETETKFCCSMSASRSAYSNEESCWRWTPMPRVRNTRFGIGNIGYPPNEKLNGLPDAGGAFRAIGPHRHLTNSDHLSDKDDERASVPQQPLITVIAVATSSTHLRR